MKLLTATTLALSLSATALPVIAADSDSESLSRCKAELKAVFGPETSLKLKSFAHRRSGDQLRIRVVPAEGDAQTVTCLVDGEGATTLSNSSGVALVPPSYEAGDTVSLND